MKINGKTELSLKKVGIALFIAFSMIAMGVSFVGEGGNLKFDVGHERVWAFSSDTQIWSVALYDDGGGEIGTFDSDGGSMTVESGTTLDEVVITVRIAHSDVPAGENITSCTRAYLTITEDYTYAESLGDTWSFDAYENYSDYADVYYSWADVNYTVQDGDTLYFETEYQVYS